MADRVRVLSVVGTAYGDLVRVLQAMPYLVAIAVVIVLARLMVTPLATRGLVALVSHLGPTFMSLVAVRSALLGTCLDALIAFATSAVEYFFLTPIFIAVHRFIILGETTHRYALDWRDPRFVRFFVCSVGFAAIMACGNLALYVVEAASIYVLLAVGMLAFYIGYVVLIVGVAGFVMRLTILFPAIAVDARGASPSNALADTRKHTIAIFLIFVVASLPFMVASISSVLTLLLGRSSAWLVATLATGVLSALMLTLFIAIASRIFQELADHLVGRPIGGVAPT